MQVQEMIQKLQSIQEEHGNVEIGLSVFDKRIGVSAIEEIDSQNIEFHTESQQVLVSTAESLAWD